MAKIVVSENVTLDGVVEDPTGDGGFKHGGWFNQISDENRAAWAQVEFEEAMGADVLLMGRGSYEYLAPRWSTRSGEWADRLRSLPKYIVSSTLTNPDWHNTSVLRGSVVEEVCKLKQDLDGEIVVFASRPLVHTLMEHDLVDEVRLIVFPFVLGAGQRLFGETSDKTSLRLLKTRTVGSGLSYLAYEVVRAA